MTVLLIAPILVITLYFSYTLKENIKNEMRSHANYIIHTYTSQQEYDEKFNFSSLENVSNYKIHMFTDYSLNKKDNTIDSYIENGIEYLELIEPYSKDGNTYLSIKRNIEHETQLINKMFYMISIIFFIGFLLILYYSTILSDRFMKPLRLLSNKFTNMNESMLKPIKIDELPEEFENFGNSFNRLITKIQTFINYRKELYVGTAHELKTPLAVMRLKNQITLMKYKKQDKIKETLQQNIDSIDTLNAMIHNILEYGRAEGAQFEKPKRVNLIQLMATKCEEYELLAQSQNRNFIYHFSIPHFKIYLQELLFMQIFQNFIQNALRFTPEQGLVSLQTRTDKDYFIIEIIDEGPGIDTDKDFFAPFKRSLESTGAGLGLFLAKNAAQSMGVDIDLRNREHASGAIASIRFLLNRFLLKE
jgi:two-component system OmpR family sensor kinase